MRIRLENLQYLLALILALTAFSAQATPLTGYFIYDESGHLIGEYDANGNVIQEHIYLGDRPVAVVQQGGSVGYVTADQLNTPRAITDQNATLEWSWTSDPFGNGQPTGSLTYNLRFPGQYYDAETGHNYNYYRDYDPGTDRYIESDPVGLYGGINTYDYVGDNPFGLVDPFGLTPGGAAIGATVGAWVGGALGGAVGGAGGTLALPGGGTLAGGAEGGAVGAGLGALAGAAVGDWISNIYNSESSDKPCDREQQCGEQLEIDYASCDAIYRAEKAGKRPPGAYSRCMNSAHQRHANCLRGQDPGPLDTWNN